MAKNTTRLPVKCNECGHRFKTASTLPYCPKCNSADVDYDEARILRDQIKQKYPEAYVVAGVGWCGPQWEEAMMWERAFPPKEGE